MLTVLSVNPCRISLTTGFMVLLFSCLIVVPVRIRRLEGLRKKRSRGRVAAELSGLTVWEPRVIRGATFGAWGNQQLESPDQLALIALPRHSTRYELRQQERPHSLRLGLRFSRCRPVLPQFPPSRSLLPAVENAHEAEVHSFAVGVNLRCLVQFAPGVPYSADPQNFTRMSVLKS